MRIHVLAVGARLPAWARTAYDEYARRLPRQHAIVLAEIATPRRTRGGAADAVARESARLLAAVPRGAEVVALDERGESWSSADLARRMDGWRRRGRDVALLIGGPDGLSDECLQRAAAQWSLSALTLPHALVRVVLAEQIYRAWSILEGHPYHRE